jgi:CheY-like chemotaxis protein
LDLTGVRILVVEDSWQIGMAFTRLLKALGAEVLGPVATSVDAQRLACEQPPHAALVDFNLRGGELAGALIEQLQQQGIHAVSSPDILTPLGSVAMAFLSCTSQSVRRRCSTVCAR